MLKQFASHRKVFMQIFTWYEPLMSHRRKVGRKIIEKVSKIDILNLKVMLTNCESLWCCWQCWPWWWKKKAALKICKITQSFAPPPLTSWKSINQENQFFRWLWKSSERFFFRYLCVEIFNKLDATSDTSVQTKPKLYQHKRDMNKFPLNAYEKMMDGSLLALHIK